VWHELVDPLLLPAPGNITSIRAWWENLQIICKVQGKEGSLLMAAYVF
jgi:hypothetical protein